MNRERSFRSLAVVAVLVATIGLGVAFAALAQQLNIEGDVVVRGGSTWVIEFDNLEPASVSGTASAANATLTATTMTFDADLAEPGDSVVFEWDIVNSGSINAMVNSVLLNFPNHPNITVTLTYADGSQIAQNDTLNAGTSRGVRLVVLYDVPAGGELPDQDINFTVSATINYMQNR